MFEKTLAGSTGNRNSAAGVGKPTHAAVWGARQSWAPRTSPQFVYLGTHISQLRKQVLSEAGPDRILACECFQLSGLLAFCGCFLLKLSLCALRAHPLLAFEAQLLTSLVPEASRTVFYSLSPSTHIENSYTCTEF